jgi:Flp pilus assembly protein CpaB
VVRDPAHEAREFVIAPLHLGGDGPQVIAPAPPLCVARPPTELRRAGPDTLASTGLDQPEGLQAIAPRTEREPQRPPLPGRRVEPVDPIPTGDMLGEVRAQPVDLRKRAELDAVDRALALPVRGLCGNRRLVPQDAHQPCQVLGHLSATGIRKDEQILETKLVRLEDAGLAYMIPKKKRAIAIAVYDVNAVGGHVKPGNYIDILGSFDFGTGDKADLRTVTLFQNVHVLAVGDDIGRNAAQNTEEDKGASFNRATQRNNGTVVISLSPLDCQKITLAQEMGSLSMTLRSLWEDQRFVELEKTSIHTAIGIPKKVRYQRRASYRTIREGSY